MSIYSERLMPDQTFTDEEYWFMEAARDAHRAALEASQQVDQESAESESQTAEQVALAALGVVTTSRHEWMALANCRSLNPNIFFPTSGAGVEKAIRICIDCPVKEPCLEYALKNRVDHGVWGGTSERERRRILRQRRLTLTQD